MFFSQLAGLVNMLSIHMQVLTPNTLKSVNPQVPVNYTKVPLDCTKAPTFLNSPPRSPKSPKSPYKANNLNYKKSIERHKSMMVNSLWHHKVPQSPIKSPKVPKKSPKSSPKVLQKSSKVPQRSPTYFFVRFTINTPKKCTQAFFGSLSYLLSTY